MPAVPLGVKAYARPSAQQPETRLVNLYVEKDESGSSPDEIARLQRPGLTRTHTLAQGAVRAIFKTDNVVSKDVLIVAGSKFIQLTPTPVEIGDVGNDDEQARIEANSLVIGILSAGVFYLWNGTTLSKVQQRDKQDANATGLEYSDLPAIVDIDVLNGYFLFATASGTFFWLTPGETSVNPLNYATAEGNPDGCLALRRLRDDIYIYGPNSIEVWQASGDADATFQRASGRLIDRGMMNRDTLAVYDNSLVWMGDDGIVYRMSDVPKRISDFGIEERTKNRTGLPSAWVFTSLGHKFYVLRIPGEGTFAYDAPTESWCEFSTIGAKEWRPLLGRDTTNGAICGDTSGGLYALDPDSSLDDGQPFLRLCTGTIPVPFKPVANTSFAIGVGSDGPATFTMRYRNPRAEWSRPIDQIARGDGDVLPFWRLGAARTPYRTYEISTLAPVKVRISGAMANESWRV